MLTRIGLSFIGIISISASVISADEVTKEPKKEKIKSYDQLLPKETAPENQTEKNTEIQSAEDIRKKRLHKPGDIYGPAGRAKEKVLF